MKPVCTILFSLLLASLAPAAWAQRDTSAVDALKKLQAQFAVDPSLPRSSAEVVTVLPRFPEDIRAGASFEAVVVLRVAPGWHLNAHRPRQSYLIGTALDVADREGLTVEATRYPQPVLRAFGFTVDTLAVYEGDAPVVLSIHASAAMRPGVYLLQGTLRVQACNDQVCLRPTTLGVPLPVRIEARAGGR